MLSRLLPTILVTAAGIQAATNPAELLRAIRENGLDAATCYRVRDLSFVKEDVRVYLNDGHLIFSNAVEGRRTGALFTADVEGGDGEVIVFPPTRSERQSLARFNSSPNLDEHLRSGFFVFADGSAEELMDRIEREGVGKKAPEMGAVLASEWSPVAANIEGPMALRLVQDVLAPAKPGRGLAFLALNGRGLGNFDVVVEPRGGTRIEIRHSAERDNRPTYDVWTSFPARSARNSKAAAPRPEFSIAGYRIEASLDNDLHMKALTHATLRVGPEPSRTLPLLVARNMQISAVRLDGAPVEWLRGDALRSRIAIADDESAVLVVPATTLAPGSEHAIEFEHDGNVVKVAGDGVFFVSNRASWYPHAGSGRSTFDVSFRYPKRLTLVYGGDLVDDRTDGDWRTTRRRIAIPVGSAGFDIGDYEKVSVQASGVSIDVYGNRHVEDALRPQAEAPATPQPVERTRRRIPLSPAGGVPFPASVAPDPLGRLKLVAADVASAVDYYAGLFGPPALKTLTVAPIPGTFGQGFPGLVYLSTFAYIDPSERPAAMRNARQQAFFSDMLAPHEVAHQWWGAVTSVERSEDSWLIEGLANYSALMWLEKKRGFKDALPVLQGYRDELLGFDDRNIPESAGPIVWGERLLASDIPDAWRIVTYGKSVWILHMLRRRMGDERFLAMLAELRKRYEFRPLTTEGFRALVQEFRPRGIGAEAIDAFFDSWVYATGIPALKLHYASTPAAAGTVTLSGTLEQSGVDEDFSVDVPVEVHFAKGPPETIWVRTSTGEEPFSATLRQAPVRVVLPDDMLLKH
ncbi:MAG TPA: M1 family aminopeptidase [Bryobacteraceae bacterium]|nr:M1 family aminopeptidase [Bryobacteraceae bacterium]